MCGFYIGNVVSLHERKLRDLSFITIELVPEIFFIVEF